MSNEAKKIILITGAGSGIGSVTTPTLARQRHNVCGPVHGIGVDSRQIKRSQPTGIKQI